MKYWHKITKNFLFYDLKEKFISLVIACFLWYYVNIFSVEKSYINLPVEIINQPKDAIIEHKEDLVVKVEILAREDISHHLDKLSAVIDLSEAPLGIKNYHISILNLPRNITANVIPPMLKISIYPIIKKIVPVNLIVKSHNSQKSIIFSPKEIEISGAKNLLDDIKSINTEMFDNTKDLFSSNLETNLLLNIPKEKISVSTNSISVSILYNQNLFTNEVFLPLTISGLNPEFSLKKLPAIPINIITRTTNIEDILLESEIILDLKSITNEGVKAVPLLFNISENMQIINPPLMTSLVIISNTNLQEMTNIIKSNVMISNTYEEKKIDIDPIKESIILD